MEGAGGGGTCFLWFSSPLAGASTCPWLAEYKLGRLSSTQAQHSEREREGGLEDSTGPGGKWWICSLGRPRAVDLFLRSDRFSSTPVAIC